jgi:hypothetical protein
MKLKNKGNPDKKVFKNKRRECYNNKEDKKGVIRIKIRKLERI